MNLFFGCGIDGCLVRQNWFQLFNFKPEIMKSFCCVLCDYNGNFVFCSCSYTKERSGHFFVYLFFVSSAKKM